MTHKHDIIVGHISHPMPIPTQAELDEEADRWLSFNEFTWRAAQSVLGLLTNPDLWDGEYTEELDQALMGLLTEDELIAAEWVTAFDFSASQAGFSVVAGEGGTWTSGTGWVSTPIAGARQVHIEENFVNVSGVKGLLLLFSIGTNNATSHEIEIKLRQNGSDITYYSAAAANGSGQTLLLETTNYPDVDRIRIRGTSFGATSGNVVFRRLILWGDGADAFEP